MPHFTNREHTSFIKHLGIVRTDHPALEFNLNHGGAGQVGSGYSMLFPSRMDEFHTHSSLPPKTLSAEELRPTAQFPSLRRKQRLSSET
jgi:hypothetical protein